MLTDQEKRCVVDVLDILVAMDINLKTGKEPNEENILQAN